MSRYIPNTSEQQKEMLSSMGLNDIGELFADIPQKARLDRRLELPEALSEMELVKHMKKLSDKNADVDKYVCFLGAGAYDHYIPGVINHILSRQEFYTAYTPYQPEISQGTLQAIFEYQTMICALTGMDVANASMYDGATALAEAASMAYQITKRKELLIASTLHPQYKEILYTYARFNGLKITEIGYKNGTLDMEELESRISSDTAGIMVQNPNFFGIIESLGEMAELAHKNKALLIACVDPISLAVLKSPGELGADIVVGEGQVLGNTLSFGGPYLGFLAARNEFMRKMPGRIVGETTDRDGKRGFVLTIQTREQHIRREKATSNICSNHSLNALAATIYMTVLGKQGLKEVAELCIHKSHYAYEQLLKTGKFEPVFTAPFFKEFVVRSRIPLKLLNRELLDNNILGGYEIEKDYPELHGGWLVAVTEKRTASEIDKLVQVVQEVSV